MTAPMRVRVPSAGVPRMTAEARARAGLGSGHALTGEVRRAMETGFGHDLGHVRIHDDTRADVAARSLGADAFALGHHIALSAACRDLSRSAGRGLLSHEMAHVVQQSRAGGSSAGRAHERAADTAAAVVSAGGRVEPQPAAAVGVQRRVQFREPGRGGTSGMSRLPEFIKRLNAISSSLKYSLGPRNVLAVVENFVGIDTEFDRQMKTYIADTHTIPIRVTTHEGTNPGGATIYFDSYESGLFDIDDFLSVDDLDFQTSLVHVLAERQATTDYAKRMNTPALDLGVPARKTEFDASHALGEAMELKVLSDFFGDPGITAVDWGKRIFLSSRGDTITEVHVPTTVPNLDTDRWAVTIKATGAQMTAQAYRGLLAKERAAAVQRARTRAAAKRP